MRNISEYRHQCEEQTNLIPELGPYVAQLLSVRGRPGHWVVCLLTLHGAKEVPAIYCPYCGVKLDDEAASEREG